MNIYECKINTWLAPQASKMNQPGKMEPSCPLKTTRCIPQEKFPRKPYNKPLLTTFVRSRWLDIGLLLFFGEFMDLDFVSAHKLAKRGLGQYPAFLISCLVNNPHKQK